MKHDVRLRGLSSDHHHTRRIRQALAHGRPDAESSKELIAQFESQLTPRFDIEAEVLLPALKVQGERDIAARTLLEHRLLRSMMANVRAGRSNELNSIADMLEAHVRFEEHELFPLCEAVLSQHVLDEVARRAKKKDETPGGKPD